MKKELQEKDFYVTADLCCASALALFQPIESVDKVNPHRAQFIFKRNQELEGILRAFWQRELKVEPRAFFESIKALKTRLYEPD